MSGMPASVRDLLVITPQVVAALWALAGLAVLSALRLRRRHLAASLAGLLALVLLPVAAGAAVNAHYQYLPRIADVVNVPTWPTASRAAVSVVAVRTRYPRGAVVTLPMAGRVSGFGTHDALVYLPPQYFSEPTRRFPVIYLVHGSPGAPVDWFRAARAADVGLTAARAGHPVLLVAPRASRSWSDDSECVDRPHEHVETYLSVDVLRDTDAQLRTIADRWHRGLAGNSAGGFCALNVGLRHRREFSVVLDLSGYDHPTYDGGLARLFGSRHPVARAAADTPADYAGSLAPWPRMHVWLDYGRADRLPRASRQGCSHRACQPRFNGESMIWRKKPVRSGGDTCAVRAARYRPVMNRDSARSGCR